MNFQLNNRKIKINQYKTLFKKSRAKNHIGIYYGNQKHPQKIKNIFKTTNLHWNLVNSNSDIRNKILYLLVV